MPWPSESSATLWSCLFHIPRRIVNKEHQIIPKVSSLKQPVFTVSDSVGQESGAQGGLNGRHLGSQPWGHPASPSLAAALLRARESRGQVGQNPQFLPAPPGVMAPTFMALQSGQST